MKMKISPAILLLLVCLSSSSAAELLFNGDFDLGTSGFGVWRLLRQDTNANLEFTPLEAEPEGGPLRLDNPYGEYWQLRSAEFDLPTEADVRFAAEFRGMAEGTIRFSIVHVADGNQWQVHAHTVKMDGTGQRAEFSFRTRAAGAYLLVVHPIGAEAPRGTIRFDSLSVDDGAPPPAEKPPFSAALSPEKRLYVLETESAARIRVKLKHSGESVLKGNLELRMADQTSGAETWKKSFPLTVPPGRRDFDAEIPLAKYGAFEIRAAWNGEELRAFDGVFSVIGRYEGEKSLNPARTFCVGINGGTGLEPFRSGTLGGFAAGGMSVQDKYKLFRLMGCRLLRDWDDGVFSLEWRLLEPEEGKFDFRHMDFCIDMARKHDISLMPVFGRMYENYSAWQPPFRPDWLEKQLIPIERNPPGTNPKFRVRVPPMPAWERYVRAFTAHAGNRIELYEIMNEPNLNLSPELYMEYMVPAARIIRQEAPEAAILGVCATGDHQGQLLKFLRECVSLGATDVLDGVSFHPYNARTLGAADPADRQIAEIKAAVGDKPVYNTELYYLFDFDGHWSDNASQSKILPHHAAQRFLTDLGEGLRMSCSINQRQLWQQPLHPRMQFRGNYATENIPNGVFVACNTLARMFEGAEPVRKFKDGNGLVIYAFRRGGGPVAALWRYRGVGKCTVDLKGLTVYDLFGNRVAEETVPLTDLPCYLTAEGMTEEAFLERLAKISVNFEQPVELSSAARLIDGKLHASMRNIASGEQKIFLGLAGGGWIAEKMPETTLSPGESRAVVLPVVPGDPEKPSFFLLHAAGRFFRLPFSLTDTACIREGEEFLGKSGDGKLAFSGRVDLRDGKVRVRLKVDDRTPSGKADERRLWENDGAELFFDAAPELVPAAHPEKYNSDTFRIFLSPRDETLLTVWGDRVRAEDCRAECRNLPDGYELELEFPLSAGPLLGFGVKVNDAEGPEKAARSAGWGITEESYKNRLSFGAIRKGGNFDEKKQ